MTDYRLGDRAIVLPPLDGYELPDASRLHTPALLVYQDVADANVQSVLRLLGNNPGRWRAHIKTAKIGAIIERLVRAGVDHLKCATTLELRVACEAGARDVLVAYPSVGARATRVRALAEAYPGVRVWALVESPAEVASWTGGRVGLFVDVNPGMDRTGIPDTEIDRIAGTVRAVGDAGLEFGGIHYYDGHIGSFPAGDRERAAHAGYDWLLAIVRAVEHSGARVPEIVTAGTPAFPWSLSYAGFSGSGVVHRVSPGTVLYNDLTSLGELPGDWGLAPAALVAATVVSEPAPGRVTCDAGHKTVSADAGVPTCLVLGHPALEPRKPSEEHLPIAVPDGAPRPKVGEVLYLVPRHVCPTVNNFDHAVLVRDRRLAELVPVSARGREAPLVG